jgi:dTDP-4-dehydrorhamnose 3,5-epimerase
MKFIPTSLPGAFTIELEIKGDSRGFFARSFCESEFAKAGIETHFRQANNSLSSAKGTLRGMHYQLPPAAEVKVVRCIRGALFDVIVDLRPDSATYGRWFGTELTAENRVMMYVPRGFAHGFLTLSENTEAMYMVSDTYSPDCERGLKYDDPWMDISWPIQPTIISDKDATWPSFDSTWHGVHAMSGIR